MHLRIGNKNKNERYTILLLLIMASGGLTITTMASTNITIFYLFSATVVFMWMLKHPRLSRLVIKILLWSACAVVISLIYLRNTRLSSIYHFVFYIIAASSILSVCNITRNVIRKLTELIVYLNLANILIALILHNVGVTNIPPILGTYFDRGVLRYMGFTSEPSYLAMEMTVCVISYIMTNTVQEAKNTFKNKKTRRMYIAYILAILLSKTSFGLISVVFVGIVWFQKTFGFKNVRRRTLIWFAISMVAIFFVGLAIMYFSDSAFLSRILLIFDLIFNSKSIGDFQTRLRVIDSSAWYRIGPLLLAMEEADIKSFSTYFGHGIGADAEYYTILTQSNTIIRGGFLQAGFYNHGIIGLISFLLIILKKCKGIGIVGLTYLLLCFCNCSISTQAFWFIIIIFIATVTKKIQEK